MMVMTTKEDDCMGNERVARHSVPANMVHLLGMIWKHYKFVFVLILLQMLAGGVMPLVGLYLPVLAVDLILAERGMGQTLWILGGFAGAYALLQLVHGLAESAKYPFQNTLRNVYLRLLFFKALDCDFRLMETAVGQTWYERVKQTKTGGDNAPSSQMLNATAGLISGLISFGFLIGILVLLNPWVLVVLVVLSVAGNFVDRIPLKFEESQWDKSGDIDKKFNYLSNAMSDVGAGKDMRVYGLSGVFDRLCDKLMGMKYALGVRIANRYFAAGTLQGLIGVVRDGLAYAYCLWQVTQGHIGIAQFVLFMGAIASFSGWVNGLMGHVLTLRRENARMNDVRGFLETTNETEPDAPLDINLLQNGALTVVFDNVTFRYTADTPAVLDGVSFTIHAGEKAALVGINGAGKTTIVKLLCGLYKAEAGEILLNGFNINGFRRQDLFTLFSAVFQDTCILPMTVAENIAFSLPGEWDEERVVASLKTAGLYEDIKAHPKGINAHMSKTFYEDGLELSGGQQQKLVLARALYKDAPILILDEPTAALDPIAESAVYEGFHGVTQGKTALFISHRLASTRFCDRILLLDSGKIAENDSHEALMAAGGEYARMFDIQSHYYKEEIKEAPHVR